MTRIYSIALIILLMSGCASVDMNTATPQRSKFGKVDWQDWSDDIFAKAKQDDRLVILDLKAIWCHWCHVMDQETYADDEVAEILNKNYIAVKVDQDSRPDLANRYRDYGWPATIIFNKDGKELMKRAGYIEPQKMIKLLADFVRNPVPKKSTERKITYSKNSFLSNKLRKELFVNHEEMYDDREGGLNSRSHRYVHLDTIEYSLLLTHSNYDSRLEGLKIYGSGKTGATEEVTLNRNSYDFVRLQNERMILKTLEAGKKLVDFSWGGVYQYSTGRVWTKAHHEKIMSKQRENIRAYILAYLLFDEPEYLNIAKQIEVFLRTILMSPEGVFYTSQDADYASGKDSKKFFKLRTAAKRKAFLLKFVQQQLDNPKYLDIAKQMVEDYIDVFNNRLGESEQLKIAKQIFPKADSKNPVARLKKYLATVAENPERLKNYMTKVIAKPQELSYSYLLPKKYMPRVDKNIYSRENGWVIESLALMYGAMGRKSLLKRATQAAQWIIDNRSLPNGGFRHAEKDKAGPYLGDTLTMGTAFLQLYIVTGDRQWLKRARDAAAFIDAHFRYKEKDAGYTTSVSDKSGLPPVLQVSENIAIARFTNLLHRYTGDKTYRQMAERAMRYLCTPKVAKSRITGAGILVADFEMAYEPIHVTVVGSKDSAEAKKLFTEALKFKSPYKVVEWYDPKEGPLPNPDYQYPDLGKVAAFLCANKACSLPLFTPKDLKQALFERVKK